MRDWEALRLRWEEEVLRVEIQICEIKYMSSEDYDINSNRDNDVTFLRTLVLLNTRQTCFSQSSNLLIPYALEQKSMI